MKRAVTEHVKTNALAWYTAIVVTLVALMQFVLGSGLHHWLYGGH